MQNKKDVRGVAIQKVGIKNLKLPMTLRDKLDGTQNVVGEFKASVFLPSDLKGTHMSRIAEVLEAYSTKPLSIDNIIEASHDLMSNLSSNSATIEVEFPYFVKKKAPVSKKVSHVHYDCKFIVEAGYITENATKIANFTFLEVRVPTISCCPCSKAISKYNAHNQKNYVTIRVRIRDKSWIWLEELIKIAEQSASGEMFTILKRPDEKYVTEKMYENVKFVEDIVRDCAIALRKEKKRINWFAVSSDSWESIHTHSAFAEVEEYV